MAGEITLKSFPFDAMEVLNEESSQMEPDRLYEAEIFRRYFAKFLSNGVYFGHYKNYGENSMKVTADGGLNLRVAKGAGIIEGADFENEADQIFTLERPASGNRYDRVIVKLDKTLAVRETQLYIKTGDSTTFPTLQRDDNIYEICLADVTVRSTSNISQSDIVDKRLDKERCGIVNSLISVDGEELYQQFQEYIDSVVNNLVRKDQNSTIDGKLTVNDGIEAPVLPKLLTNGNLNDIKIEGFYYSYGGNTVQNKPKDINNFSLLVIKTGQNTTVQIISDSFGNIYTRAFTNNQWYTWRAYYNSDSTLRVILNGAVSGSADFASNGAVTVTTKQANIAVLTGTIQMPEKDSSTLGGSSNINYPAGFTSSNCCIISLMGHNTLHPNEWSTIRAPDSVSIVLGNGNLSASLEGDKIVVRAEKLDTSETRRDITFKLVLMKIA